MRQLLLVLVVGLAGAGGAVAQTLPQAAAEQRDAWFAECRSFGGRPEAGPDFATRRDLNGDGVDDVVLSVNGMNCNGAYTALCPGQACPLAVFLSGPGGHRRAFRENVHAWQLLPPGGAAVFEAAWLPSHCGPRPRTRDGCSARYAITGQAVTEIAATTRPRQTPPQQDQAQTQNQGRQGGRAAAPGGAAPSGAWQLRPVQGRGDAAMAEGPGVVAGMALFCNGPVPMAAFTLRALPPPGRTVVTFAFATGRVDAPIAPAQGSPRNVWYADLRASRLPRLLAGNEASVPLLINGGQQGRLSLAGSTAAITAALAPCYPF
jgi:hypothetical protein